MPYQFVSPDLRRLALGLLLAIPASPPLADQAPSDEARQQWHLAIGQGYAHLADAAEALAADATAYCQAPTPARRNTLEAHWLDAYRAWQAVRFIDFGPIEQQSRGWQLQFWPDNKNLVGRQLGALLNAEATTDSQAIAAAGVAVQGFPALEYLLFDERLVTPDALIDAHACALLESIASHVATTGEALADDWQAFGEHYRTTPSYTSATLQAALQALETLEIKRLGEPLGLAGTPANGYRAEAWRSGQTLPLIEASLAGLEAAFLPGVRPLLTEAGHAELAGRFATALDEAQRLAASLAPGLAPALEDEDAFATLQGLYVRVSQLVWLGDEVAGALGLVRGFNASDGD